MDFLGAAGIEAAHWASVGEPDALDTDIMAYAAAGDYVVLTHDLDFGAILAATNGAKPSVVQFRTSDLSPDVIGHHLVDALRRMDARGCGFCHCGIDRTPKSDRRARAVSTSPANVSRP